ncbi:MAG: hypothetical protein AB1414_13550 [bacterium]
MPEKLLLGQILVEEGILTKEQLHQALLEQKKSNKKLGRILVDLGFLSEEIIIDYLTHQITDILEECEDITSHLVRKSHELIREKPIIYKKTPFIEDDSKKEIYKRLFAGREKLNEAKTLFRKGMYEEVVINVYHAMYHLSQIIHRLQEPHHHFDLALKTGIKSVFTGRTGTSQVERRSIFTEKVRKEINLEARHQAKTIIKDGESYLKRVEESLRQRKGIKI